MTKDEIEIEAKAWFALLRAKEREISLAELDVRRKNRETAELEKQKSAATELAKATQESKSTDGNASDRDKEAAAKRLDKAQKDLARTVEVASREAVKEEKKAEATTEALSKEASRTPAPRSNVDADPPTDTVSSSDQLAMQKAAENAQKKTSLTKRRSKRL
jgi:small conductance mechanosensitive channel